MRGYLELGMLRHAEAELKAIRPQDAEVNDVSVLRVALLHEKEDWRRLRRLAARLVQREPQVAEWWVSLAFATRRAVSVEAAREILVEAQKRHPEHAIIEFNLGCYACVLGLNEEARVRVRRSIALDPSLRETAKGDPDLEPLRAVGEFG